MPLFSIVKSIRPTQEDKRPLVARAALDQPIIKPIVAAETLSDDMRQLEVCLESAWIASAGEEA
jgi:hypothetical protein